MPKRTVLGRGINALHRPLGQLVQTLHRRLVEILHRGVTRGHADGICGEGAGVREQVLPTVGIHHIHDFAQPDNQLSRLM